MAISVGCAYLPLGYYTESFLHAATLPLPQMHAALLPLGQDTSTSFSPTPLVFSTQLVAGAPTPFTLV